jgi:hypothetical protein
VSIISGAAVAITFFLPAVHSCGSDTVPAAEFGQHPPRDANDVVVWFTFYLVAYLLGGLLSVAALGRFTHARWARHVLGAALALATLELTGLAAVNAFALRQRLALENILIALVALALALYLVSSRRLGEWGMLRGAMTIAAAATVWFGFWSLGGGALYGVVISFAGSLALLGATIAEGWRLLGRRLFW